MYEKDMEIQLYKLRYLNYWANFNTPLFTVKYKIKQWYISPKYLVYVFKMELTANCKEEVELYHILRF